ncbi:styrene monooxygenase/indole monooxygenase family protein [Burkholderia sp. BCC1998]|uniref:styrene monooxygenase/indole monooxygenase family protein n=1 Tax=Burkholderia sp. BCC1998 TaxID=2817447 RepID=UPI002AB67A34|nr:styrene monooxygenase/indole monooxygenase family protein [Burkholderia sp. BCC1998]
MTDVLRIEDALATETADVMREVPAQVAGADRPVRCAPAPGAEARRPSRAITVVGGGQAGLMLAVGLRRDGHSVRLVQDRSADEIAHGRVLSSQCMFAQALDLERALGMDQWAEACPEINSVRIESCAPPGMALPGVDFTGRLRAPAQSVDQRLKFPVWLDQFQRLGGTLDILHADVDDLDAYAKDSELVVVATGKGALGSLFEVDRKHSPFSRPMRTLAMVYLRGGAAPERQGGIHSTALPGAGGLMRFPALTLDGACEILFFEAFPDGPLDVVAPGLGAHEQWAAMHGALARLLPAEAERLATARPTDALANLAGKITPAVRHAVGVLPSGRMVLGLGDAVVLNDPLVGQGANNAAKVAATCLAAIRERGHLPFDSAWMQEVAGAMWRCVRPGTLWTQLSLLPPKPPVLELLHRACTDLALADRFAQGFDQPETLLPLLLGKELVE